MDECGSLELWTEIDAFFSSRGLCKLNVILRRYDTLSFQYTTPDHFAYMTTFILFYFYFLKKKILKPARGGPPYHVCKVVRSCVLGLGVGRTHPYP